MRTSRRLGLILPAMCLVGFVSCDGCNDEPILDDAAHGDAAASDLGSSDAGEVDADNADDSGTAADSSTADDVTVVQDSGGDVDAAAPSDATAVLDATPTPDSATPADAANPADAAKADSSSSDAGNNCGDPTCGGHGTCDDGRCVCALGYVERQGTCAASTGKVYYVQPNGGTAAQCDGLALDDYPGTGTAQRCAFKHPWIALPPVASSNQTPFVGGDTLFIVAGSYMLGYGALDDPNSGACESSDWTYDCVPSPIPSGTADNPTRIVGQGFDSGCSDPPELWGTRRMGMLIDLGGSHHVGIQCLDLTDHAACTRIHDQAEFTCTDMVSANAQTGIAAVDSSHVLLRNLWIHGLDTGVHAGRLSDWTLERVYLRANVHAGWDGDVGADQSSNSGTITFRHGYIAWSGCIERYPDKHAEPVGCVSQDRGGYGDGLGTHNTGANWVFDDFDFLFNVSDGLDLLYYDESGTITISNSRYESNAGNAIKVMGDGHRFDNLVVIGNCGFFDQELAVGERKWPSMVNHCRAMGNTFSTGGTSPRTVYRNISLWTEGDCAILGNGTAVMENSLLRGHTDYHGGDLACFVYSDSSTIAVEPINLVLYRFKNDPCEHGINAQGQLGHCVDPGFVAGSSAGSHTDPGYDFDLRLHESSLFAAFSPAMGAHGRPHQRMTDLVPLPD